MKEFAGKTVGFVVGRAVNTKFIVRNPWKEGTQPPFSPLIKPENGFPEEERLALNAAMKGLNLLFQKKSFTIEELLPVSQHIIKVYYKFSKKAKWSLIDSHSVILQLLARFGLADQLIPEVPEESESLEENGASAEKEQTSSQEGESSAHNDEPSEVDTSTKEFNMTYALSLKFGHPDLAYGNKYAPMQNLSSAFPALVKTEFLSFFGPLVMGVVKGFASFCKHQASLAVLNSQVKKRFDKLAKSPVFFNPSPFSADSAEAIPGQLKALEKVLGKIEKHLASWPPYSICAHPRGEKFFLMQSVGSTQGMFQNYFKLKFVGVHLAVDSYSNFSLDETIKKRVLAVSSRLTKLHQHIPTETTLDYTNLKSLAVHQELSQSYQSLQAEMLKRTQEKIAEVGESFPEDRQEDEIKWRKKNALVFIVLRMLTSPALKSVREDPFGLYLLLAAVTNNVRSSLFCMGILSEVYESPLIKPFIRFPAKENKELMAFSDGFKKALAPHYPFFVTIQKANAQKKKEAVSLTATGGGAAKGGS